MKTELAEMTDAELIAYRDEHKHMAKIKDVEQMAKKILI